MFYLKGFSSNPNFSIALLDGHRQFVSHEKFQQQLHRQWQEQRRSDQLLKKKMFQRYCKYKGLISKLIDKYS